MNRVVVECRKIGYSAIGMFSVLIIIISFLLGSCYMDSDYRSYTVIEMFFLPKRQEVLSNIEMNWLTVWANSINGWVPLILPAALSIGYLFVLSEERESGALRQLLLRENGTVTIVHSHTKNLKEITAQADIVVAAIGKANYITADYIKEGAVVIDVGINRNENGKLCGDVDFAQVSEKASAITPVPGGVGPMTIAMLMQNCLEAFRRQNS